MVKNVVKSVVKSVVRRVVLLGGPGAGGGGGGDYLLFTPHSSPHSSPNRSRTEISLRKSHRIDRNYVARLFHSVGNQEI